MVDDGAPSQEPAADPAVPGDGDGLTLDESFVRAATVHEPPARTRAAIARYGDEASSWRQGAPVTPAPRRRAPGNRARGGRRSAGAPSARRRGAGVRRVPPPVLALTVLLVLAVLITLLRG